MTETVNDDGIIVASDNVIINFKTTIDYTDFIPPALQGNPFYQTLIDAWGAQDNLYLYQPINLLRQLRDNTISTTDGQLLLWKIARRGIALPNSDNELDYLNYLNDNISLYYRTAGNSPAFISFMSFITATNLTYQELYATLTTASPHILDINSLVPGVQPAQLFINGGVYYPTPYYSVTYNSVDNPDFDYTLIKNVILQLAPIYLVLVSFTGVVYANATLYLASNQALVRIKQYCI